MPSPSFYRGKNHPRRSGRYYRTNITVCSKVSSYQLDLKQARTERKNLEAKTSNIDFTIIIQYNNPRV